MSIINPTSLSFEFPVELADDNSRRTVIEFLTKIGYQQIQDDASGVHAKRGAWWGWFIGGDPRRLPHSILICRGTVFYEVVTQLGWFSSADKEVFRTEFQSLLATVGGNPFSAKTMEEVQRVRRKTDIRNIVIIAIVAVVLTFAVLFTFF